MTPRIQPLQRHEADSRSEAEFQRIESLGGYVPNIHLTFGIHPDLFTAWLPFAVHIMPNSTLAARDRQLLILGTSYAWRAPYSWSHHAKISERLGVLSPAEIERIEAGPEHPAWSEREAALLSACLETRRSGRVLARTWASLANAYGHQELLDIVFTIGQYTLVATVLNSIEVQLDPGFEPPAWSETPGEATAAAEDDRARGQQ